MSFILLLQCAMSERSSRKRKRQDKSNAPIIAVDEDKRSLACWAEERRGGVELQLHLGSSGQWRESATRTALRDFVKSFPAKYRQLRLLCCADLALGKSDLAMMKPLQDFLHSSHSAVRVVRIEAEAAGLRTAERVLALCEKMAPPDLMINFTARQLTMVRNGLEGYASLFRFGLLGMDLSSILPTNCCDKMSSLTALTLQFTRDSLLDRSGADERLARIIKKVRGTLKELHLSTPKTTFPANNPLNMTLAAILSCEQLEELHFSGDARGFAQSAFNALADDAVLPNLRRLALDSSSGLVLDDPQLSASLARRVGVLDKVALRFSTADSKFACAQLLFRGLAQSQSVTLWEAIPPPWAAVLYGTLLATPTKLQSLTLWLSVAEWAGVLALSVFLAFLCITRPQT